MNEEMMATGELVSTPATIKQDMRELRDNPAYGFDRLLDVTAVDRGETFEIVYRLNSLKTGRDLVVKVALPIASPNLPSLADLWESALFGEREVQDMFGIVFEGHPDPRPLLAPEDGFGFFPLRKSYVLPGRSGQPSGR
ncbi:MAG TPA: NADH-quinone oxidoreductase subunit C [Negativicutes bacterium]|nr:NADH-quinone oxidoreductase subunit C [Negativicutes bacterium]